MVCRPIDVFCGSVVPGVFGLQVLAHVLGAMGESEGRWDGRCNFHAVEDDGGFGVGEGGMGDVRALACLAGKHVTSIVEGCGP